MRTVGEGIIVEHKKQLEGIQQEKNLTEKNLKRKIIEAKSAQKAKVVEELRKDHPDVAVKLSKLEMRAGKPGRRPIEEEQPGLQTAIMS